MISITLLISATIFYILWLVDFARCFFMDKNPIVFSVSPIIPIGMFLVCTVIGKVENRIKHKGLLKKTNRIAIILFFLSIIITIGVGVVIGELMYRAMD